MKTTNTSGRSQPIRIDLGFAQECDRKNRNPIRRALRNWRTFAPLAWRVAAFSVGLLVLLLFVDIDLRLRRITDTSGRASPRPLEWYLHSFKSDLSSMQSDISSIESDLGSIKRGWSTVEVKIDN